MNEWPEQYPGLDLSRGALARWESHAKTVILVCIGLGFASLLLSHAELAHAGTLPLAGWSSFQGWFTDGWSGAYDAGASGAF